MANGDQFAETTDVLILPKAVTIKPNSKQKLRVVLQKPAAEKAQSFYRVSISEVLGPDIVAVSGLRFLLSISIPIFSRGLLWQERSEPEWAIVHDEAQDQYYVTLTNKGNNHLIVQDLLIAGAKKEKLCAMQYVLPASAHRWAMPAELSAAKSVSLKFNFSGKDNKVTLAVPNKKLALKNKK